jgi:hypothetical protein
MLVIGCVNNELVQTAQVIELHAALGWKIRPVDNQYNTPGFARLTAGYVASTPAPANY